MTPIFRSSGERRLPLAALLALFLIFGRAPAGADGDGAEAPRAEAAKGARPDAEPAGKEAAKDLEKPADKDAAKSGEASPAAGAGDAARPVREKPRDPPVFRMHDGTRISGEPRLDVLTVRTAYGVLEIPKADLVRVRFAVEKDPTLESRIEAELERLKSEEFETRETATEKLRGFGRAALKLLNRALKSDDEEVKSRAQALITEIDEESTSREPVEDESSVPIAGEDDEVVTSKFTMRGRVELESFRLQSLYGELAIHRRDVISVVFQEFSPGEAEFDVPATFFAPQNNWFESKVVAQKGDALEIVGSGQIQLLNYGWTVGPEGTTNVGGNHFKDFPAGALVAKVGKRGKPFHVSGEYKGKADASGKLMFAIAFRGGQVSGTFSVKAQVRRQEKEE